MAGGVRLAVLAAAVLAAGAGCSALQEQERRWIFQPSKDSWGGGWQASGMDEVWIDLPGAADGTAPAARLNALWLPQPRPDAPLMLYLHGARWDVRSSAGRMRRMHELGFAVLGIDYRGFGRSSERLPSERSVHEDALAAWRWLGARAPGAARYVYGHSLGGAIAVELAAGLDAGERPAGLVLEGAFTSIPDLIAGWRYGWIPVGPLVTQRFDAASQLATLRLPLVVVHGSDDHLVPASLGRALYDRAPGPDKRFVLVEGGSHHNAGALGAAEVAEALAELHMGAAGHSAGMRWRGTDAPS